MHVEGATGGPDHGVDDRTPDEFGEAAAVCGPHDQLGGVLGPGHLDERRGDIGTHHLDEATAEVVEQGPVAGEPLTPGVRQPVVGAHVHADQLGLGPHGHARRPADQHRAAR